MLQNPARLAELVTTMRQTPSPRPKYARPIADDGLVVVSPFVISIQSQRFYRG